jgi:hypothetical protein
MGLKDRNRCLLPLVRKVTAPGGVEHRGKSRQTGGMVVENL